MNFDLSEEQQVVADLAQQIIGGQASVERVKAAEATDGYERGLWQELASANLLGLCLPEEHGGSGMGMVELALLCQAQGRHVAPVPLLGTVLGAMAVAEHGTAEQQATLLPGVVDGSAVASLALAEAGANDPVRPATRLTVGTGGRWHLCGDKLSVPFAQHARWLLVPARTADDRTAVVVVDPSSPGVALQPVSTTDREPQAHVTLDVELGAEALLGGPSADGAEQLRWLFERAVTAVCATQVGVAEGALAHTAGHISTRVQFGKPLAAFQAVTQRAADAYITTEAMRVTMLNAAWRLDEGLDARADVMVAAYWASEGAQQVVLAAQHLHGGIGADVDYPVHRHFLWGIQLATALGAASSHLARLGQLIRTTS